MAMLAVESITKSPPQLVLDQSLATATIKGVQQAFSAFFGAHAIPGKVCVKQYVHENGDISGILEMIQSELEATLVVTFQKETLFKLLGRIYRKEFREINNSVREGAGELTNVIYAAVKRDLNGKGHTFKMATPIVVLGQDHKVVNIHAGKTLKIPFKIENDSFFVEVTSQR